MILLEELTAENIEAVKKIDRSDISETFVDTVETIWEITEYGVKHHCKGHTFVIQCDGTYIGVILLGEAIPWETDPPEMRERPFYRLMGFVLDRAFRGRGIGSKVLEMTIQKVCDDFGARPIALGCHKENRSAMNFYLRHGFQKTNYMEGNDVYMIRYQRGEKICQK